MIGDYKLGDKIIVITKPSAAHECEWFTTGKILKIVQMEKDNNECVVEGVNTTLNFTTQVSCPDGKSEHRMGWSIHGMKPYIRFYREDDPCGKCKNSCRGTEKCAFYEE